MVTLYIKEEYGFAHWVAVLTDDEYRELIRRWETMRGVDCLVPVPLIVPQATRLDVRRVAEMKFDLSCHVHECGDSYLDGSDYKIPPSDDGLFWIDGKSYDSFQLHAALEARRP